MGTTSDAFVSWTENDHSSPIAVTAILFFTFGLLAYTAITVIKYMDNNLRAHGWWNNFFSALVTVRHAFFAEWLQLWLA
jgi:hypothetical protein